MARAEAGGWFLHPPAIFEVAFHIFLITRWGEA